MKKIIEKSNIDLEKHIVQEKFENPEELIKNLNNNKKYYIITIDLWIKICKDNNKEETGILYKLNKNKIILNYDTDRYEFIVKKGIIELQNEKIEVQNNKNESKNIFFEFINKYKNDIEILIRLYIYIIKK